MSSDDRTDRDAFFQRVHGEVLDSFDEELKMELDDERLSKLLTDIAAEPDRETIDRHRYFHELFRLQGELVKETMLERTHIPEARWWVVVADEKKKARLNCIHHLLTQIPYQDIDHAPITLPARVHNPDYIRTPVPGDLYVPAVY